MSQTLEWAVREVAARLAAAGTPDPLREARLLTRWAVGMDGARFAASTKTSIDPEAWARLERAACERADRRPMSHIIGVRSFYGREFVIDGRALDPRPESETLVAEALAHLADVQARPRRVLDLGVGSGCLLASVLLECREAQGLGVDASEAALSLAAENITRFGLSDRIELQAGDWLAGLSGQFDAILCNPPYIGADEVPGLSPEVLLYEPHSALTPGEDGLAVYRALAPDLASYLSDEGCAFFEVGAGQAGDVAALLGAEGLSCRPICDLGGIERVVTARPNLAVSR